MQTRSRFRETPAAGERAVTASVRPAIDVETLKRERRVPD